jgi:hypothetical protein
MTNTTFIISQNRDLTKVAAFGRCLHVFRNTGNQCYTATLSHITNNTYGVLTATIMTYTAVNHAPYSFISHYNLKNILYTA